MLSVLGIGAGSAALVACAPGGESAASSSSAAGTTSASAASTSAVSTLQELNSETAGPYPGDGSNGPDVLDETGICLLYTSDAADE